MNSSLAAFTSPFTIEICPMAGTTVNFPNWQQHKSPSSEWWTLLHLFNRCSALRTPHIRTICECEHFTQLMFSNGFYELFDSMNRGRNTESIKRDAINYSHPATVFMPFALSDKIQLFAIWKNNIVKWCLKLVLENTDAVHMPIRGPHTSSASLLLPLVVCTKHTSRTHSYVISISQI